MLFIRQLQQRAIPCLGNGVSRLAQSSSVSNPAGLTVQHCLRFISCLPVLTTGGLKQQQGHACPTNAHTYATLTDDLVSQHEWTVQQMPDLQQKRFVVTGGTSGIGFYTARQLARHNAQVVITARSHEKGLTACEQLNETAATAGAVTYHICELSSLRSVYSFATAVLADKQQVDGLIANAAVFAPKHSVTEDAFELTLGVNYFAHWYLIHLLLEQLLAAPNARIVIMASILEAVGSINWDDVPALRVQESDVFMYGTSKCMLLMLQRELHRRLQGQRVDVFAAHPGLTSSPIFGKMDYTKLQSYAFLGYQAVAGQSVESGALPVLYAATAPELQGQGGQYFGPYWDGPASLNLFNTTARQPDNKLIYDADACLRLYNMTKSIIEQAHAGIVDGQERHQGAQQVATGLQWDYEKDAPAPAGRYCQVPHAQPISHGPQGRLDGQDNIVGSTGGAGSAAARSQALSGVNVLPGSGPASKPTEASSATAQAHFADDVATALGLHARAT